MAIREAKAAAFICDVCGVELCDLDGIAPLRILVSVEKNGTVAEVRSFEACDPCRVRINVSITAAGTSYLHET